MSPLIRSCAALALTLSAGAVHAACSSAGCAVNTNWETQGPHLGPGWRIDLRFEYIDQNTLRKGTKKVAHPEAGGGEEDHHEEGHSDAGETRRPLARVQHEGEQHAQHDERATLNRNARVHFDYSFNADWGVGIDVPILARKHTHVELDSGATEKWDFTALGDMRVLARYSAGGGENMSWGFTFGAKLPTGKFDETNDDGEAAERTLQPGSGTTDALLGAFYQRGNRTSPWSWFGQFSLQQAFNSRDEFKPGRQISLDLGAGYRVSERVSALLQINLLHRARDQGANAEPEDSGGESAYLSPGVQVRLGERTQAYAFVQLPAYQHVNGTQLTSDHAFLLGLSHRF